MYRSVRPLSLGSMALFMLASPTALFAGEEPVKVQVKQLVQPAGQAAAVAAVQRNFGYNIPLEVDPADKTERVLLFLPGGPLVVEIAVTIDGKPFQAHREQMIDEALKGADADKDGKTTWDEALAKPGFAGGRFGYLASQNEEVRKRSIAQFDQNKDSQVDRYELRGLLAQYAGGPAFLVQAGFGQQNPPVKELLDLNKDNVLSTEELSGVEARLKSRDANDNDIVDLTELSGNAAGAYGAFNGGGRGMVSQPSVSIHHLHEKSGWAALHSELARKYGKDGKLAAEHFPLVPDLVKRLDGNDNGLLEADELSALLVIAPHVSYEANFGESGELPAGGKQASLADGLRDKTTVTSAADSTTLEFAGARMQIVDSNPKPSFGNLDGYTTQILNTYDKDKNGYLEKEELGGQQQLAQQFATWDVNEDGKVYADEIKKSYERQQIPTWQRVTVSAADQGNSLFSLLDADNNGRLSLREMRTAAEQLKKADKNSDGQITLDEIPGTLRLTVARGNVYAGGGQFVQLGGGRGGVGGVPGTKPAGPEWFVRMDRNGDGDLTMREFLGDEEQFKKLDANGDGFVELKEAEVAK